MTTTSPHTHPPLDARRWPDVARVPGGRLRAAVARAIVRHATARSGVRVRTGSAAPAADDGAPVLELRDPDAFHRRLAAGGLIGFGESYMAGEWDSPDLVALLTRLAADYENLVPRPLQPLRHVTLPRRPASDRNTRAGSRRHISHHYDLSNDLFGLFLDRTMTYSSALFEEGEARDRDTLPRAQERKIDRLLDAAGVAEGVELLEIGTGWGELPCAPPAAAPASPPSPSPPSSATWPSNASPPPGSATGSTSACATTATSPEPTTPWSAWR